ncbi:DedA family protein [Candidatus Babeliales bacterium]|nr:DedA family protein [Candidatus Babeliales bacterium]
MRIVFKLIRRVYDWMGTKVHSPYAPLWLISLFFIEAFCFPIPVDPLLILFCVENPKKSLTYAAISTVSSVLGGILGYTIGSLLWDGIGSTLVQLLISPEVFESVRIKYAMYQTWAVLIAGFSPLPYKAVTLSAGFCKLPVAPFIFYSIIARGARFFLVGSAIKIWGVTIKDFIDRYFNQLIVLFVLLVGFCVWAVK